MVEDSTLEKYEQLATMPVSIVTLTNGELIAGIIISETDNNIVISNPALFYNVYYESGNVAQSIQPFHKFSKNEDTQFQKIHILNIAKALESVEKYYRTYMGYVLLSGNFWKFVERDSEAAADAYREKIQSWYSDYTKNVFKEAVTATLDKEETELFEAESPSRFLN